MTALSALAATLLFGDAGWRLSNRLAPRGERLSLRIARALVLGASLLCAGYGLLGQLCARERAEIELVFHGDEAAAPRSSTTTGPGELRVIEDRVTRARARPQALVPIALACALLTRLVARARPRRSTPRTRNRWRWLGLHLPLVCSGLAALASVPRGYDALWYHLPMAAAFARDGHLEPPGRDLVSYFPGNLELLSRTLHDLLGRALGPTSMALVQLPFALVLGVLTTGLSRRLGAGRAAFYAGAIAASCPIVIFQAGLAYADVVSVAALVAALVFFERASATLARRDALLGALAAGLCLGLGLGSKYAALPLLASGAPFLLLTALAGPSARGSRLRLANAPRALALLSVLLVGVLIPAWFWYARNARLTGNPIFPIAIPELGLRGLFLPRAFNAGKELELVGNRAEWMAYPWLEALSHESGFGAAFAALVPLSLLPLTLTLVGALRRRRWPRYALPFGWGLSYLASWWFGTPHEVRHLLPIVVLLGAPAALLLRGGTPRALGLRRVQHAALFVGLLVVLRIQLFSPTPEQSIRPLGYAALYGLPAEVLDDLPRGARVANLAGRPYNLPLLGPRLTLKLLEFSPDLPSAGALDYHQVDFVFLRGSAAHIAEARSHGDHDPPSWRVRYQGRPSPAAAGGGWTL